MALRNVVLVFFVLILIHWTHGQLTSDGDLSACPPHLNRGGNLVVFQGHCYEVVTYEALTWKQARDRCVGNKGRLLEIMDSLTMQFIISYMDTVDAVGKGVWLGLHDKDQEGTWVWDSGAPLRYSNWGEGQPGGVWGWLDDCGFMGRDGRWSDYPCDVFFDHFHYVCQHDVIQ